MNSIAEPAARRTVNSAGPGSLHRGNLGQKLDDQMSELISSFRELRVYQLAFKLQQRVFNVSKSFPVEERYSLTDQIRRASRSVGANISEAWQKRRYPALFINKLTDSAGEQSEMQHWLETARACEYISDRERLEMLNDCQRIGQMLGTMISKPEKFCHGRGV